MLGKLIISQGILNQSQMGSTPNICLIHLLLGL